MKKIFLIAMLAAVFALVSTGCKKEPCQKACDNMAEMAQKKGEKKPESKDMNKCVEECKSWPDDVKNCLADAGDEAAIGGCMQKLFKLEMEKAMKKAGEAAPAGEGEKKEEEKTE